MPYLPWSDSLSVGIPAMDQQHKHLLHLLNELFDAAGEPSVKETLAETFEGLLAYVGTHFRDEEALMQAHEFPGLEAHTKEHEHLTAHVLALKDRFAHEGPSVASETTQFLRRWLFSHIASSDKLYGDFISQKAENEVGTK
jgi:hemerythrin